MTILTNDYFNRLRTLINELKICSFVLFWFSFFDRLHKALKLFRNHNRIANIHSEYTMIHSDFILTSKIVFETCREYCRNKAVRIHTVKPVSGGHPRRTLAKLVSALSVQGVH